MTFYYHKHVLVVSLLLGVVPLQVLSRTLQEDIVQLSQTSNSNQFTVILQKIKFKDIFNNETVKRTLSPKYKSEYLELIAGTDSLVEVIDVDSLMSQFHAKRNVTNMAFLEMVLENMDALIAVNFVDWSSYIINSDGGKISKAYTEKRGGNHSKKSRTTLKKVTKKVKKKCQKIT